MPINIFNQGNREEIDWICDNEWELPEQIRTLEKWLVEKGDKLEFGSYAADIGYNPREGASGGGVVLSIQAMSIMVRIGMVLQLSEYSNFAEDYSLEVWQERNKNSD